jgi:Uri superfamily endonuclease
VGPDMGVPSPHKGSYLLLLILEDDSEITVGKLGRFHFPAGLYCYVGSGRASLYTRVGRHFSVGKKVHWHIDYLLEYAQPFSALLLEGPVQECDLRTIVSDSPGSSLVCPGFGSSDCSCPTHLYLIEERSLPVILNELRWLSGP